MNQKMPSTLTDHFESNDVRARFRKCVRRLLVLNKGKEGRKLKIVELIEFIRSRKQEVKQAIKVVSGEKQTPMPKFSSMHQIAPDRKVSTS